MATYNRAFEYLLEKYGYKLKFLSPSALKKLKTFKDKKIQESIINDRDSYVYLIQDSNLEDTDALIFVLMSHWQQNSNVGEDLHNLLISLNIIEK